ALPPGPRSLPLSAAADRLRGKPGRPRKRPRFANCAQDQEASAPSLTPAATGVSRAPVPAMCPRLLDLPGAAGYLSVSTWTLRDMLAAGTLRAVRLPGADGRELRRILLDVRDLDALVESSKEAAR